jgi:1,4-dihydroxy-2-naphthoate octaprenyltransferase
MIQILLNDLRDQTGDRTGGTLSLPVLIGDLAARCFGAGLALSVLIFAWLLTSPALIGIAVYSLVLLWRYRRSQDAYWRALIEGQGVLAACLTVSGG